MAVPVKTTLQDVPVTVLGHTVAYLNDIDVTLWVDGEGDLEDVEVTCIETGAATMIGKGGRPTTPISTDRAIASAIWNAALEMVERGACKAEIAEALEAESWDSIVRQAEARWEFMAGR